MAKKLPTKYRVCKRLFLNREADLPAFIIGIVQDTSGISDADDSWKWGEVELKMGDCYRRVAFDFNMDSREERASSLYKINRIAEVVNAVRDAIETEVEALNKRPHIKAKQKKAKE
jgi:hypothetical protein